MTEITPASREVIERAKKAAIDADDAFTLSLIAWGEAAERRADRDTVYEDYLAMCGERNFTAERAEAAESRAAQAEAAMRGMAGALAVPRVWSAEERDGMAAAYQRAGERHGFYETLFAVGAWLLRHRAASVATPTAAVALAERAVIEAAMGYHGTRETCARLIDAAVALQVASRAARAKAEGEGGGLLVWTLPPVTGPEYPTPADTAGERHEFVPSLDGFCAHDTEGGDECGLPRNHPIHGGK